MEMHDTQRGRRVLPAILAVLLAGMLASSGAQAQSRKSWITVGDAAFVHLQKVAPNVVAKESTLMRSNDARETLAATERVHLVLVDNNEMMKLSAAIHNELKRCGGFIFHSSEAEGKKALARQAGATVGIMATPPA